MICPACGNTLSKLKVNNIEFDVCKGGCGGVWFDWFELQKVDEQHEAAGEALLDIEQDPGTKVDFSKKRKCPKCGDVVMMQHFFSVKRKVMVDECPKCGGFWLDCGELREIRKQFKTDEEREQAAKKFVKEVAGPKLAEMKKKDKEKLEKSRKVAKMFKFICPSTYIPGDQKWGAY